MGRTNNDLCPVAALAAYITLRGSKEGSFFLLENQAPLTQDCFVKMTRDKLSVAGIYAGCYYIASELELQQLLQLTA